MTDKADLYDEFSPNQHQDHALEYIATMLGELSEMAAASGKTDLADLIRVSHRVAASKDDGAQNIL